MKSQRLMMMAAITCGISLVLVLLLLTGASANVGTTHGCFTFRRGASRSPRCRSDDSQTGSCRSDALAWGCDHPSQLC
jgi:hypothetical protein